MRQISPYLGRESVWDFMREVEKAFDDVSRAPSRSTFTPAVDLHETKDAYVVSMDLPGVHEKEIKIDVQHGTLTVSGERSRAAQKEEGGFRRFERAHGHFERTFALPQNVNQEKIAARFEHGVLEIQIPKAEVVKSRSIAINAPAELNEKH